MANMSGHEWGLVKIPFHKRPDLILEAAYNNPLVRRWHKRAAMNDWTIDWWKRLILRAGQEDAEELVRNFNSMYLGFVPLYKWNRHDDGIFVPEDFTGKKVRINNPPITASKIYDTDDVLEIIPQALGVTRPEQIALRATGTASPVLNPRLSSIDLYPRDDDNNGFEIASTISLGADDGGEITTTMAVGPGGDVDYMYLNGMFLPRNQLGRGLGLAAYSSLESWAESLGATFVSLEAVDVGRYMWPLLGFDTPDYDERELQVSNLASELAGDFGHDFKNEDEALEYLYAEYPDIESLPEIAHFEYKGKKVGMKSLLRHYRGYEELSKDISDNYYITKVADRRIRALKEST